MKRPVELGRVTTGQVGSTAGIEEERVAGDQTIVDQEALAPRCVSGGVDQLDVDAPDGHDVAGCVRDKGPRLDSGDLLHELGFGRLHVNWHVDPLEKLSDAVDLVTHHGAADMIGVIVRSERAGECHPIRLEDVDQGVCVIGRIDDDGLAGRSVADEVREVDHLLRDRVGGGEISARQQLAEVDAIVHERTVVAGVGCTSLCRVPKPRRIAYLGPRGTYSEEALRSQADLIADAELVPMRTFVDILTETQNGSVDMGLVAIENAIEGTVNASLDTLAFDTDLLIQREVLLDITMNLMARPGTSLDGLHTITSHPVANAQCRTFLRQKLPEVEVVPANSTAEAAQNASQQEGVGALGPALAGEIYGLDVLASDIADMSGNQTRFLVVSPSGIPAPSGHDKTTVVIAQRADRPGSLVSILNEFSARNINLTKLTSRPAKTQLGQYCFIVDFNGHITDDVVANCLLNVRAKHADVKFLGSYPAAGAEAGQLRADNNEAWQSATQWLQSLRDQVDS